MTLSLQDFAYAFLSVLFEGVPFLLLGTLISGLIDEFLPSAYITRWLPSNPAASIAVSALLGAVFPICECGVVPVIRRLLAKGLPLPNAIAYMLAAPIVNPIVAFSTFAAFRGQGAAEMTVMRITLGWLVACAAGFAVSKLPASFVLREGAVQEEVHDEEDKKGRPGIQRLMSAMRAATHDFLDVLVYFTIGVAVASIFATGVNRAILVPLASNDWTAVATMMLLAVILALCSTSDAFIAATFVTFPAVAKLAFLVFGPMIDLKLFFIYSALFRKRFVASLTLGLFLVIGLLCVRLSGVLKL